MVSLKEKSSIIVIIDRSGTMRSTLSGVLKEFGYGNVLSLKSLKEFTNYKNRSHVSWIITHSYLLDEISAFHLLRLALENEEFKDLRVTILFDETEQRYIRFAFALGALSYHIGAITPAVMRDEFANIMNRISKEPDYLIAASFCRDFLKSKKLQNEILSLEASLLEGYDHSAEQFLRASEAYFLSGDEQKGREVLFESLVYHSHLREEAHALSKKYLGKPLDDKENTLQFNTCILIDSDIAVQKALKPLLEALHFKNIVTFDDGRKALDYARHTPDIDLIITEWKVKEITGPILIQILRHELTDPPSIIVCSSLLKKEDEILLHEINVNKLIEKPIRPQSFLASTIQVLKQSKYPSDHTSQQREIRLNLKKGNIEKALAIFNQLSLDQGFSQASKKLLEAEILYEKGDYKTSRDLAIQAAGVNGYDAITLSLIGKVLIKLGEHEKAIQYLKKADSLSPNNMERICNIALEHAELGDNQDAQKLLSQLRKEAPNAIMVKEASVKSALKRGQHEEANAFLGNMDSQASLITFWNNQGISYVKQGKINQGLKIYKQALAHLPPGYSANRSFIRYNLALAYAKASQFEKALLYLFVECSLPHSPVIKKVRSLYYKVNVALNNNTALTLSSSEDSEEIQSHANITKSPLQSYVLPGELCLWGLYKPDEDIPEELLKDSAVYDKVNKTG